MNPLKWIVPWWAQPLLIAMLFAALLQTRATLHDARQDAVILAKTNKADAAEQEAKWAKDGKAAAETYAGNILTLAVAAAKSRKTVDLYAQTPEGRAPCLSGERVQSILADRATLFAIPSEGGGGTLRASPNPAVGPHQR